jgi:hypothetical protein
MKFVHLSSFEQREPISVGTEIKHLATKHARIRTLTDTLVITQHSALCEISVFDYKYEDGCLQRCCTV